MFSSIFSKQPLLNSNLNQRPVKLISLKPIKQTPLIKMNTHSSARFSKVINTPNYTKRINGTSTNNKPFKVTTIITKKPTNSPKFRRLTLSQNDMDKYLDKFKLLLKKSSVKKTAAKKPAAKKPVAKKPATKKPVAKKHVAKKPSLKKKSLTKEKKVVKKSLTKKKKVVKKASVAKRKTMKK